MYSIRMQKSFKDQIYVISYVQSIIIAVTPTRFFHLVADVPLKLQLNTHSPYMKKALGACGSTGSKRGARGSTGIKGGGASDKIVQESLI